jgi:hypothetical protein
MAEQIDKEVFVRLCQSAGDIITETLMACPKPVAVCVLPGVLAAVMRTFEIPRETLIAMLDAALEDIDAG